MATVFTRLSNGNVKVENTAGISILNANLSVTPHAQDANLIIIGHTVHVHHPIEQLVVDWRDISTPTVTSRDDAITKLGTNFFFDDLEIRVTTLEDNYEYYEIFQRTSSGTGQVTVPTGATIILDFYPEGVDALVTKVDTQGRPLDEPAVTSGGVVITTTFDVNGNYVLSGVPSAYPVAIVYFIKIPTIYSSNVLVTQLVQQLQIGDEHTYNKVISWSVTPNNTNYPSEKLVKDSLDNLSRVDSCGPVTTIVITDNGNGNINLSSINVYLNTQADFSGVTSLYTIASLTNQQLTANTYTYITVNYNSGTPVYQFITDNTLINHSTILNIAQVYWENLDSVNELHVFKTGTYGLGLPNKTSHRLIHTERFGYESGLGLSEYGTRNIRIESGKLWYDSEEIDTNLVTSATTGHEIHHYYPVSSAWHVTKVTQYPNTQYNNGTDLASITGNKYVPIHVFKGVNSTGYESYIVLGNEYTSVAEASVSALPTIPTVLAKATKYVGRIIIKNGDVIASKIISELTTAIGSTPTSNHALLSNLDYASSGHTGFEATANKATTFGTINDTLYPTVKAANDADTIIQNNALDDAVAMAIALG